MIQGLTSSWRQTLVHWYDALREAGRHCWPQRQAVVEGEASWLASRVISGGPVQAVEETKVDVIIHATFPRLAFTEVTMEMAGDRLLIQGKTPRKVPTAETRYANAKGKYELRICSAVLPCAVDLMHAKTSRKHDMVQITIPKKPPETLQRGTEKGQEIG